MPGKIANCTYTDGCDDVISFDHASNMDSRLAVAYLEVSALVERLRRPEERHLPLEHVLVVDQLGADAFEGVVLQRLELEGERADG